MVVGLEALFGIAEKAEDCSLYFPPPEKMNALSCIILGGYYLDYIDVRSLSPYRIPQVMHYISTAAIPPRQSQPNQVKSALKKLTTTGWLSAKLPTGTDVKAMLEKKHPQSIDGYNVICEWCLSTTVRLESHHFPIPRAQGGTETVSICPSCHSEYHFLVSSPAYRPAAKLIKVFQACNFRDELKRIFAEPNLADLIRPWPSRSLVESSQSLG